MSSTTYTDMLWQMAPSWLQGLYGRIFLRAIGAEFDARVVDRTTEAAKAKLASHTDTLPEVGQDRGIVRGPGESDASYTARCRQWIPDRTQRGSPWAMLRQLGGIFDGTSAYAAVLSRHAGTDQISGDPVYTLHRYVQIGQTSTHQSAVSSTANQWLWYPPVKGCELWVVIYPSRSGDVRPALYTRSRFGDGRALGSGVIGSTLTREQAAAIRVVVRAWAPEHTFVRSVILSDTEDQFTTLSGHELGGVANGYWRYSTQSLSVQVAARNTHGMYSALIG